MQNSLADASCWYGDGLETNPKVAAVRTGGERDLYWQSTHVRNFVMHVAVQVFVQCHAWPYHVDGSVGSGVGAMM